MKKIRFVQLEPMAVLADSDLYRIGHKAIACYLLLVMHLYDSNGKLPLNMEELAKLCICDDEFGSVWEKIRHKFIIKDGVIKHNRVSRELREAKKRCQVAKKNGLRGAEKRWQGHSSTISSPIAKENKGKLNEGEDKENKNKENESEGSLNEVKESKETVSNEKTQVHPDVSLSQPEPQTVTPDNEQEQTRTSPSGNIFSSCLSSLSSRMASASSSLSRLLYFDEEMKKRIHPRSQSDRTSFINIGRWLMANVSSGNFTNDIFDNVLKMADEIAADRDVRNPPAVLMDRLKRELGYNP